MNHHFQHNRPYFIHSGLDQNFVLDCSNSDDMSKKFNAIIFKKNNGPNQTFEVIRQEVGSDIPCYIIYNRNTNRVLQVQGSKINNGARIFFGQPRNTINQLWQLIPVQKVNSNFTGKPAYFFRSFCGKTIDIKHAKAINENQVFQYDYNGNPNQIWIFE